MNPKVNFLLVGLFVIGICLASIIFILWLSFGYGETKQKFYLIYMKESVAGLSLNAAVKFNGVNVGTTKEITLDHGNPAIVLIKIQVDENTPISVDTRATLMSQGLTGLSYINLSGGTENSPPLKPLHGQTFAIIPTNPSLLVRLDSTINKLTDSFDQLTKSFNILLRSENQQHFTHILKNFDEISSTIADHKTAIGAGMMNFPTAIQNADQLLMNTNNQTLPTLNQSLLMLQTATLDLTNLSQELMNNPSILLTGPRPVAPGPGEQ